jgi:hypothetical protein
VIRFGQNFMRQFFIWSFTMTEAMTTGQFISTAYIRVSEAAPAKGDHLSRLKEDFAKLMASAIDQQPPETQARVGRWALLVVEAIEAKDHKDMVFCQGKLGEIVASVLDSQPLERNEALREQAETVYRVMGLPMPKILPPPEVIIAEPGIELVLINSNGDHLLRMGNGVRKEVSISDGGGVIVKDSDGKTVVEIGAARHNKPSEIDAPAKPADSTPDLSCPPASTPPDIVIGGFHVGSGEQGLEIDKLVGGSITFGGISVGGPSRPGNAAKLAELQKMLDQLKK